MLTGPDLIAKVKELGEVSKSDLVRACGYVSTKKDGTERLNFTAFYEALLNAKGVALGENGKGSGQMGRKLSYITKVQFNGNLLVGKAYTALLGLQPGDEFEIKLGRKQIKLIPLGASDEEAVSPLTGEATDPLEAATSPLEGSDDEEEEGSEEEEGEDDED